MDYFTTTSTASRRAADCTIVGVFDGGKLGAGAADIDKASKGSIRRLLKSGDVSGSLGKTAVLNDVPGVRSPRVVVVGLGKAASFGGKQFRTALAAALRAISASKAKSVFNVLPLDSDVDAYYIGRATAEVAGASVYRFTAMKSGRKPPLMPLKQVVIAIRKRGDANRAQLGAKHGDGINKGAALAKELGNLPPNVCTPSHLARTAQKLARNNSKVTTRIMNEAEMKRLGMHSLLSVTAGTAEPAKLIVVKYRGGKGAPIVLVGKGVTFDSGGISLKPGPAMDEMKFDMCGAAGVLGTIATAIALKLPINVNVVIPAVENLPGANATVPGDIVKSLSGQTIEILNTDAEGRLILCDALTYARRFKPAAIVDVATLTGACVIALGRHHTGVMTHSDDLADEILGAGVAAEDRGWRLPLTEEYSQQLKSNFADFANVGGREGGAITAGCFLAKFTDGLEWAHLDIAGTAWKSGAQKGATGRPVPMLTEWLLARAGALPRG